MIGLPALLLDPPGDRGGAAAVDALSDVLRALRLCGGVFLDGAFSEPWCILSQVGPEDCRALEPPPAHLIAYHYVLEGCLFVRVDGRPPLVASAGQLLVLPRNDLHTLGSGPDLEPVHADALIEPAGEDGLARIRHGGGGAPARILCGFLGTDQANDPLLASLPPLLSIALEGRALGPWIEGSIRYAARELAAGDHASRASLARMAELLFAEAVREYVKALPADATGWLAGLRDPWVGRALALLHARLAERWTLATLAREAGLSRSALGERFARQIGVSPMRYLARRRLLAAADRLREGRLGVAEVAAQAGYDSEAAFSRAFKRAFGAAPAAFRKEVLAGPGEPQM
jgi:AraC-like DNA-binding protein